MTTNAEFQTPDDAKTFTFKAETKQLLNILIHSLYKEREIFLREIISNASDALNRIRFEMLTDRNVLDPDAELCVRLSVDVENKIITVQDTGIGMTKDELVENLGTIAQSGARAFLEAAKEEESDLAEIIGQFGVGFYSVFMVAEWVRVTSRSYKPRARAALWYATGEDNFQVAQAEKMERGTTIQVKLKEDVEEFANEMRLKEIVKRHSDYVGFPIYVGDAEEQVNQQTAIWRTSRQDLTDEQYKEFYRQLTLDFEENLYHLHINTDAPLQVYSVLYIPAKSERGMLSLRKEDGLKLYSKNVLIEEYSKDLLPEHFRFIQGVVDSEDLPLNVSRETIQATGVMARLRKILTGQLVRELENLAEKDAEKFQTFWQEFGNYVKQGVAMDHVEREKLYPLLRFKTNQHPDEWLSLEDYIGQMQDDQKVIYYIVGDDPKSVLRSPHLDYFRTRDVEVLLLTDPVDSFMLMGLQKYKDYEFKNVAQAELEVPEVEEEEQEKIPTEDFEALVKMFKEQLGDKILDVRSTNRLSNSVARLVDPKDSLNPEMQRVYRYLDREYEIPKKILELNPSHPILAGLCAHEGESELTEAIVEQIYESALLVEGLHPDPSDIVSRVQKIMQAALER
jgi:molecular chaperone HtpG